MAKEFDIYLNNRLTQCDIIVYSIPHRDGLTAMNKLMLESCIEEYTLMKFIAMQTESEFVSHIDEMLKTCYERLTLDTNIDASAKFNALYAAHPETATIELSADDVKLLTASFTDAESAMQIVAAPLLVYIGKSVGSGESTMELDATASAAKHSIEKFSSLMELDAKIEKTNTQSFLDIGCNVPITSEVANLCYRVSAAVDTAMEITAAVLDTEIHFSFGSGENAIVLGADVDGGNVVTKHLAIKSIVSILADMTESIAQFMHPTEGSMLFGMDAESIIKRRRLLGEMDADALVSYDDMTLEEVDFVIL